MKQAPSLAAKDWCDEVGVSPALQVLLDAGSEAIDNAIIKVTFDTPNQPSAFGTIELNDPALLGGMEDVYWESYLLG